MKFNFEKQNIEKRTHKIQSNTFENHALEQQKVS